MLKTERKLKVDVSEELYERIVSFKEVIEAVMDEKYEMNEFMEGLLGNGVELLLERLLANVNPEILIQSFQQLGARYPKEVYGYIADTFRRGGEINKEELKKTLGFQTEGSSE